MTKHFFPNLKLSTLRHSMLCTAWTVQALLAAMLQLPNDATAQLVITCGGTPAQNSQVLQQAINDAQPGQTLTLPSGTCVVAKCEVYRPIAECYGPAGRHMSALNLGRKRNLIIQGAADGSSVLKLDPAPPRIGTRHAYCPDTHVISAHLSQFLTFRGFTIDGADGELPEDDGQCPTETGTRRISEHMYSLHLKNTSDVTITGMKFLKAHADGINMIAELKYPEMPASERINIDSSQFLDNDRAGITFQRNVGFVNITGNIFRNSGNDQDIDMEPTGDKTNVGPYNIVIDNNVFDRVRPGVTVSIGTASTQWSKNVRFTRNTIRRAPDLPAVTTGAGGCIFINGAEDTYIARNRIVGAANCETIAAQKVSGLTIENNVLEGYTQFSNASGEYSPRGVIDIKTVSGKVSTPTTCGAPPRSPCPYVLHYPARVVIHKNTLTQMIKRSVVIQIRDADSTLITDNELRTTGELQPIGTIPASARSAAVRLHFGVADLPGYGYYTNKKAVLAGWRLSGNRFSGFEDGLHIYRHKSDARIAAIDILANIFSTRQASPRGIALQNSDDSSTAYVDSLNVNGNFFGCGLSLNGSVLPEALVLPLMQTHVGDLGSAILCQ